MGRERYYDDEMGLEDDDMVANSFRMSWPVNEVVLFSALNNYMTVRDIAEEYDVTVEEVIDLCERYDLDWN